MSDNEDNRLHPSIRWLAIAFAVFAAFQIIRWLVGTVLTGALSPHKSGFA
jgi:hypothetical protein